MSPYIVPGLKNKKNIVMQLEPNQSFESKMTNITDTVCDVLQVDKKKVFSKIRQRPYVTARQLSMYFIRRNYPHIPMKNTGDFFGGRDHTTVIHSIQTVKNLIETHPPTRAIVSVIDGRL